MGKNKSLYKYVTADTAEIIIKNSSLRWSSPLIFNDPFDVIRSLSCNFHTKDLIIAIQNLIIDAFKGKYKNVKSLNTELQKLIDKVSLLPKEDNDIFLEDLRDEFSKNPQNFSNNILDEFEAIWQKTLKELRILCLSEDKNITSMWNHYCDKYTGAVLEFSCQHYAPWIHAEKVDYIDKPHPLSNPMGLAEIIILKKELQVQDHIEKAIYQKSNDWLPEKEWRTITYESSNISKLYNDYKFDKRYLKNIYFGLETNEERIDRIVSLSKPYPNINFFKATAEESSKMTFFPL